MNVPFSPQPQQHWLLPDLGGILITFSAAQELFLAPTFRITSGSAGGLFGIVGIEPGSLEYRAMVIPAVPSLHFYFQFLDMCHSFSF